LGNLGDLPLRYKGGFATVGWSPDGKTIVTASVDGVGVWDASAPDKGPLRALVASNEQIQAVAVSPDGKSVATVGSKGVRFHELAGGVKPTADVPRRDMPVLAFSPDSKIAACAARDGAVHLYDAATGKQILRLQAFPEEATGVAFSPDGKILATTGARDRKVR